MLLCQRWTCSAACSTLWPPTAGSQWTSCPSSLQGLRSRPQRSRSRRPSSSTQGLFKDLQYHQGGSQGFFSPTSPQGDMFLAPKVPKICEKVLFWHFFAPFGHFFVEMRVGPGHPGGAPQTPQAPQSKKTPDGGPP